MQGLLHHCACVNFCGLYCHPQLCWPALQQQQQRSAVHPRCTCLRRAQRLSGATPFASAPTWWATCVRPAVLHLTALHLQARHKAQRCHSRGCAQRFCMGAPALVCTQSVATLSIISCSTLPSASSMLCMLSRPLFARFMSAAAAAALWRASGPMSCSMACHTAHQLAQGHFHCLSLRHNLRHSIPVSRQTGPLICWGTFPD